MNHFCINRQNVLELFFASPFRYIFETLHRCDHLFRFEFTCILSYFFLHFKTRSILGNHAISFISSRTSCIMRLSKTSFWLHFTQPSFFWHRFLKSSFISCRDSYKLIKLKVKMKFRYNYKIPDLKIFQVQKILFPNLNATILKFS